EVKRRSADGSVGLPHVRVGNCQAFISIIRRCLMIKVAKGLSERTALFAVRNIHFPRYFAEKRSIQTRFISRFINVITFLLLSVCDNIENNSFPPHAFARCFHCVLPNYNNLLVPYA
ncbi:hypothetical protein, partial [Candidatus Symbiopectobacterium sp. NZEC151]|uniref:hypothetical protein n=1 Tax=Candidatus Symbiopectobacterium sp. NZEC151 TaxID=2820470 RepID=UPI002227AD36